MAEKEPVATCQCLAKTDKDILEAALQIATEYTEATIKTLERRLGAPSCQELQRHIREYGDMLAKISNTPTCGAPVKPTAPTKPAPTKK